MPVIEISPSGKKRRRSVVQKLIEKNLMEFTNNAQNPRRNALLALANLRVESRFRLPEMVEIIHLKDVFLRNDLEIWNDSPGLPWRNMGYATKAAIRDDVNAQNKVRWDWHRIKTGHPLIFPDCCAYAQSHNHDRDGVVIDWEYPATVTFGEAMFALPLIEAYKESGPIAYGYEPAAGGFRRFPEEYAGTDFKYVFKFNQFEKTVPAWLIHTAFDILCLNINFVRYRGGGVPHARSMIQVFEEIRNYFVNTTIRLATGRRFKKDSGIAAGSYFTQLVGSVCNAIILEYCHLRLTNEEIPNGLYMGNESLIRSEHDLDVFEVGEIIQEVFGMSLNYEKCSKNRSIHDITFLTSEF